MTRHMHPNEKETNAGGGHIDLPKEQLEKAVRTRAGHPGAIDNAAGMHKGKTVPAPEYRTLNTQPQTPHPPSENNLGQNPDE